MKFCAIYYRRDSDNKKEFHQAHRKWIESINPKKITSFIPDFLDTEVFGKGMMGQILSFIKGLSIPRSDVYILESIACLPCILFKKGKKIVINSDVFVKNIKKSKGLTKKYSLWLINKVDGFVSTSEMMKEMTLKYSKKPNEVVYPCVSLNKFQKIRADLDSTNLCSIGLSVFPKGTDILIKAFNSYKIIFPESKLFILGEDPYRKKIQNISGVVAPGRVTPEDYLSKSSIDINSSRHESFGINIMEAMAAGVVPIVSENCGAKTFVRKVDKRLIVPLFAENFVKAAVWLRKSGELKELSEKCKKVAKEFERNNKPEKFKEAVTRIVKK